MSTATSSIRLIGEVSDETRADLRETLLCSSSQFAVYKRTIDALGLDRDDILRDDPVATLQKLPLLEGEAFHELTVDSLSLGGNIVDIETSSGTTGPESEGSSLTATRSLRRSFLRGCSRSAGSVPPIESLASIPTR